MSEKSFNLFLAETIGTFTLVFIGCGAAILNGDNINFLGIALAFGLALLTMAYAIGPISGCHINPAVSFGMLLAKKINIKKFFIYSIAQLLGAAIAGGIIYLIASGKTGFEVIDGFATNGYGEHSPDGYDFLSSALTEIIMTFLLVLTALSTTYKNFSKGFEGLALGMVLTMALLFAIPITNGSLNPARSFGVAIYEGGIALEQLWFFFVMPAIGALLATIVHKSIIK